jgi:hypothetical protein
MSPSSAAITGGSMPIQGCRQQRAPRLALLTVVLFLGIATFTFGGGMIVLGAFVALALRPAWFQPDATDARPAAGVPPTTASA